MPETEEATIKGAVTHVFGLSFEGWRAGRLRTEDGDYVSFSGNCVTEVGQTYSLHGRWEDHPTYGRQLKVSWGLREFSVDWDSLQRLFEIDKRFKHVGKARSQALVEAIQALGGDLAVILADDSLSARLRKLSRVPRKVIRLLRDNWEAHKAENETKLGLLSLEIPPRVVERLWSLYGATALPTFRADPWAIREHVENFSLEKADLVGLVKLGFDRACKQRLEAGLNETLHDHLRDGHTWTARERLVRLSMGTLQIGRPGDRQAMEKRLAELLDSGDHRFARSVIPNVGEVVSDPRILSLERRISSEFVPGVRAPNPHFQDATLEEDWEERLAGADPVTGVVRIPNEAQIAALRKAVMHKRLVITGPAGVGKTLLVALIVKLYLQQDLRVALAAPTGKAAKRLSEVSAQAGYLPKPITWGPRTIHKILGCSGYGEWKHGKGNPLPADVVIVDESSMLDVDLCYRVLDALEPGAALVLVGDPNQLPSVGPGAVLRDLIDGGRCEVAVLDKVMRHAGVLKANAQEILRGIMKPTTQERKEDGTLVTPWTVEDRHSNSKTAYESILRHFEDLLSEKGPEHLLEIQVLSPQYANNVGVKALNKGLQQVAQRVLYDNEICVSDGDDVTFLPGDKVVQTKNDYTIDLMNGDQGIVVEETDAGIVLEVPDGAGKRIVCVPKSSSEGLMLAYAITVHRFQGSQAETVIAAVHSEHSMNSRKLVYTAATRATKQVFLIGDRGGLHGSLRKVDASFRRTFMASPSLMERFAREFGSQTGKTP